MVIGAEMEPNTPSFHTVGANMLTDVESEAAAPSFPQDVLSLSPHWGVTGVHTEQVGDLL